MLRNIRYAIEEFIVTILFALFKIIGLNAASNLGSFLARTIGPILKVDKIAKNNLLLAFPDMSKERVNQIIAKMWDNLGRTIAETPHLKSFTGDRFEQYVTVEGKEILDKAHQQGNGFIVVGGHFANWEMGPRTLAEIGYPTVSVYRQANNPYVDKIIQNQRETSNKLMVPKGKYAAKELIKELKSGGSVGMLVDQKMNNGISVPFFGRDTMTAPAAAELALKFNCPIIPARVIRQDKNKHIVRFYEPLDIKDKSPLQIMTGINRIFEQWIAEYPEQWFWVHKRWPKE